MAVDDWFLPSSLDRYTGLEYRCKLQSGRHALWPRPHLALLTEATDEFSHCQKSERTSARSCLDIIRHCPSKLCDPSRAHNGGFFVDPETLQIKR